MCLSSDPRASGQREETSRLTMGQIGTRLADTLAFFLGGFLGASPGLSEGRAEGGGKTHEAILPSVA